MPIGKAWLLCRQGIWQEDYEPFLLISVFFGWNNVYLYFTISSIQI